MREGSLKAPVRHPVDWKNKDFYDEEKLDAELRRVFDICHGCRRCFNLCDSFPRLFDLIDASPSGELHDVRSSDFKPVVDACTLCDMCFMTKCPYVPPHEFNVDFPHLMLRYRATEAHKGDVSIVDRELTKTDRNGALAQHAASLANWATATDNTITRPVMEAVLGIHHSAALPKFTDQPFVELAAKKPPTLNKDAPAYGHRKAVLYATCSMNYNDPELGMIARAVLARNGVETEVIYPSCCGMPQLEKGQISEVVKSAQNVASTLLPWINKGYDIIAMVPSCALMLKLEWPLLVPKDDPLFTTVKKLADSTYDLSEYIVMLAKKHGLAAGLTSLNGDVALHLACHARAQNMGAKSLEMLKLLPNSDNITVLERCSGHGGSWGIMKENFETALKVGKPVAHKAADVLRAADAKNQTSYIASECPLAAEHIAQGVMLLGDEAPTVQHDALNPIEIFALSYGIDRTTL